MSVAVASLELSEELFKLSGWDHEYHFNSSHYQQRVYSEDGRSFHYEDIAPKYSLGYLLRKLAGEGTVSVRYVDPENHLATDLAEWYGKWIAYTPWLVQGIYPYTDNPEDAAAKLAIELFKQGVLTREAAS